MAAVVFGILASSFAPPPATLPAAAGIQLPGCAAAVQSRAASPAIRCVASPPEATQQNLRVAALIAVPLAWGTYGPAVKLAYELQHVPPAPVLQASFQIVSFSGLILAGALRSAGSRRGGEEAAAAATRAVPAADEALSSSSASGLDVPTIRAGAELGLWLFLGQALQLQGLQRTDAAIAGFLVQLTTLFVPLAEALLLGRTLSKRLWTACASATAGLAVISAEALQQAMAATPDAAATTAAAATAAATATGGLGGLGGAGGEELLGDLLVAASALLYTTHVVRLGEYASTIQPLPLARAKAGAQTVFCLGTIVTLTLNGGLDAPAWASSVTSPELATLALVALWNGLIPSAFTTWAQTYGQAAVPPSAANVLYSFQPVWNAGLATLILGESLSTTELVGGAFIVLAAVLAAGAEGEVATTGEAA